MDSNLIHWSPDGRVLTFSWNPDNRAWNLWAQPLDGIEPRQLTHFTSNGTLVHAWSPDGKQLALARRTFASDVVLINEPK